MEKKRDRCDFGYSKQREDSIEKQIKIVKYKKYANRGTLKLFLKWVSLSGCLLLLQENAEILFICEGVTYWVHIKQTHTLPSNKLLDKEKMYASHGVRTIIAYNFYEIINLIKK